MATETEFLFFTRTVVALVPPPSVPSGPPWSLTLLVTLWLCPSLPAPPWSPAQPALLRLPALLTQQSSTASGTPDILPVGYTVLTWITSSSVFQHVYCLILVFPCTHLTCQHRTADLKLISNVIRHYSFIYVTIFNMSQC